MSAYLECMSQKCTFSINERTYYWCGGFGAIFKSYERGVRPGDTRVIGQRLFYAYVVYPRWLRASEVGWTTLNVSVDQIREIHGEVFGRW